MSELPFKIPNSLASYLEQYEKRPDKTITRLQNQLQKHGSDAVGYFLLGWFYLRKGSKDRAIDCALKAKVLAPGSPFFKKLHYFFSHPDIFDAWHEQTAYRNAEDSSAVNAVSVLNLDSLIKKLSHIDSNRMRPKSDLSPKNESLSYDSANNVSDIVTETLAKVHEEQGNTDAAINAYQKLKNIKKEKASFYNKKISELQKIKSDGMENK